MSGHHHWECECGVAGTVVHGTQIEHHICPATALKAIELLEPHMRHDMADGWRHGVDCPACVALATARKMVRGDK